jgi:hypothetical protein
MDEPLTVPRFLWLAGWVVVALMAITVLLVPWNMLS